MSATLATLPQHEVMINNILARYRDASPTQLHDGEHWYDEAREYCQALALTSGLTLETVAAITALLSPKQAWDVNKRNAARAVAAIVKGEQLPSMHTGTQMAKIAAVVAGANPYDAITGPKEGNFFRNLVGDHSVCTVDRWAYLTATGTKFSDKTGGIGIAVNRRVALAYEEAALVLRIPVAIVQAIVWVVERGSAV